MNVNPGYIVPDIFCVYVIWTTATDYRSQLV